ncbi:hypothetical protein Avi_3019 [Allorhizobium ampelinum S4]|uniref:Uncharacterized protein n=1 Tax=Allorhizobium ampelinum (strain ATCC BAA-846 / DSM 112012 / S4) TaxID=311402 RepID=B9JYE7_ALLAM|nr:hypothetical protein Avi_3019 [Allorhizobium ampelinum S4]
MKPLQVTLEKERQDRRHLQILLPGWTRKQVTTPSSWMTNFIPSAITLAAPNRTPVLHMMRISVRIASTSMPCRRSRKRRTAWSVTTAMVKPVSGMGLAGGFWLMRAAPT